MIGFILAAVALPAVVLWACVRLNGGVDKITAALPTWLGLTLAISLYIIIGPFVGLPRFSGVAYETILPLIGAEKSATGALVFSLLFFAVTFYFAIRPGRILAVVGKFMAPVLVLVLVLIAFGAVFAPQGTIASPDPSLALDSALGYFAYGFEEGYQTLNALATLVLAIVIINSVRGLGLDDDDVAGYTMKGMLVAGIGLAITFASLSYLGATSHDLVALPQNVVTGVEMSPPYAKALYGIWGMIAVSIVVTLACLTTSIGLMSSCGTYFSNVIPLTGYRGWIIIFTILSILMANIGLGPLLILVRPVLLGVYPIAMCVALLCLVQDRMPNQRLVFLLTLTPVIPLGIIDGFRTGGVQGMSGLYDALSFLPLYKEGFGWVIPALIFYGMGMLLAKKENQTDR